MKDKDEWSVGGVVILLAWCIVFYVLGFIILFLFQFWLFSIAFFLVPTIIIIPVLIEAKKKIGKYVKRVKKNRKKTVTVVVGGIPSGHKRKHKQEITSFPVINDEVTKGKLMQELGLWYEKSKKTFSFEEKNTEPKSSIPGRTYRQLNELFEVLKYRKRIRIARHANIGSDHHGSTIRKMLETEAKRRGVCLSIKMKGKDMIIEKR